MYSCTFPAGRRLICALVFELFSCGFHCGDDRCFELGDKELFADAGKLACFPSEGWTAVIPCCQIVLDIVLEIE